MKSFLKHIIKPLLPIGVISIILLFGSCLVFSIAENLVIMSIAFLCICISIGGLIYYIVSCVINAYYFKSTDYAKKIIKELLNSEYYTQIFIRETTELPLEFEYFIASQHCEIYAKLQPDGDTILLNSKLNNKWFLPRDYILSDFNKFFKHFYV